MGVATVFMFLVILFLPRLIVLTSARVSALNTLGPVFLCYLAGLLLSFAFKPLGADISLASDFSSVLVCIGMPLILFSVDLPAMKKLARPMLVSYGMNVVATLVLAVAAFFLFRGLIPHAQNVSAMLIGDYVGGTPNIIAIGNSMGADPSQIVLLQSADIIAGGIYFFLLLSVLPRLLKFILPEYKPVGIRAGREEAEKYAETFSGEKQPFLKAFGYRAALFLLALACVAAAIGVVLLIPSKYGNTGLAKLSEYTVVIMLIVTTAGVALSFIPKVRNAPGSYSTGQYCLLVFALAMGMSFDLSAAKGVLAMFGVICFVQFGTVLLHVVLARLGRIDYHTMMITSTAGIFGPPFIIPVANALKNDEIILPGILCGILGLAIANYFGIGVGELLRLFGG